MDSTTPSPTVDDRAIADAMRFATQLRESAQEAIVASFRAHMLEGAPEPADRELKVYARLVANERRMRRRYDAWTAQSQSQSQSQSQDVAAAAATPPLRSPVPAPRRRLPALAAVVAAAVMAVSLAGWMALPDPPTAPSVTALAPAPLLPAQTPPARGPAPEAGFTVAPLAAAAPSVEASTFAAIRPQASRSRSRPDPLAGCRPLNFLARAICFNERCAMRSLARDPHCAPVLAQRQLDDARRNPLLLN